MRRELLMTTAACAALAGCGGAGPQATRHVPPVSAARNLTAHKQASAASKHPARQGNRSHKPKVTAASSGETTPSAAPTQPVTHSYTPPTHASTPTSGKAAPTVKPAPETKPAPEPKPAPTHTTPPAASPGGEGGAPASESTKTTTTTTGRPHNEPGFY
ncbi:MAG: hypothetical protein ACTHM1_09305 [Solirubrobacteraceae bacterium]